MNPHILLYTAMPAYLLAGATIGARLFRPGGRLPRVFALGLAWLAVTTHGLWLTQNILTGGGFDLGFFNALSLAAWTIALLLVLSALTKPVDNLGILLFPLAALALWLENRYPVTHVLGRNLPWGVRLHILISILAYSLLAIASVQAILLAIQDHHLHNRHPGGFIRALPPMQTMESLLFEMIGAGFVLLTLSLATGFAFLEDMFAQHLVHKTVLAVIGWVVFGTLLWGRFRRGWRGRTAITWTLAGFVVLMLAYFGSKAVLELILKRSYG